MLLSIQIILIIAILGMITLLFYYGKTHIALLKQNNVKGFLIGLITDFGDTLGIGSFATTTALFKVTNHIADDRKLPGTLNVAHALPVLTEALLFISVIKIELTTLVPMTTAAVLGAFLGPKFTKNWHTPTVQKILAFLLLVAALIMIVRLVSNPGAELSNQVHGLSGGWLVIGVVFNFILGILMTLGLGNYAPELIFFSLVGLNPSIAFPIMMLDAALIMPAASINFLKQNRIEWRGLIGISLGGIIGVILAVTFVTNLDLTILKIIVIFVALWTAYTLFKASLNKTPQPE